MGKVTVIEHVSLDGVMQGPARADEDDRDGFEHGGWPMILSGLKTWLETGELLTTPGSLMYSQDSGAA